MKVRKPLQKISLGAAYFCYMAAMLVLLAAGYWAVTESTDNSIFASLLASMVFLVGSGIVLHVMGAANLPNLGVDTIGDRKKSGS